MFTDSQINFSRYFQTLLNTRYFHTFLDVNVTCYFHTSSDIIFTISFYMLLTHMQCNVSLCNGDSGRPAGVVKNFNVGYISLIHIDHMDLYPPDL